MANEPVINVNNANRVYGKGAARVAALDGVSFTIERGEFVAIVGASGSGKSTLMNLLGALDRQTSGFVEIGGFEIKPRPQTETKNWFLRFLLGILLVLVNIKTAITWFLVKLLPFRDVELEAEADFRNKIVGFVFQQFQLMPRRSALKNVMLPMQFRRPRFNDEKERAKKALEAVGLSDRMDHKPTQLSGGQQQRVAIARALVGEPEILLADEPTGALDSVTSKDIMALLHKLNRGGLTVIIITHDPEVAEAAERVITLRDGKIISDVRTEMAA